MAIPLLSNATLKRFLEMSRINQPTKDFLISQIPRMNALERIKLFKILSRIYLLDKEEEEAVERIKKFWKA